MAQKFQHVGGAEVWGHSIGDVHTCTKASGAVSSAFVTCANCGFLHGLGVISMLSMCP